MSKLIKIILNLYIVISVGFAARLATIGILYSYSLCGYWNIPIKKRESIFITSLIISILFSVIFSYFIILNNPNKRLTKNNRVVNKSSPNIKIKSLLQGLLWAILLFIPCRYIALGIELQRMHFIWHYAINNETEILKIANITFLTTSILALAFFVYYYSAEYVKKLKKKNQMLD